MRLLLLIFLAGCNITSEVPISENDRYEGRAKHWERMGHHYLSIADTCHNYELRQRSHSKASRYFEQAAITHGVLSNIHLEEYRQSIKDLMKITGLDSASVVEFIRRN